jgi:hypothetical protein
MDSREVVSLWICPLFLGYLVGNVLTLMDTSSLWWDHLDHGSRLFVGSDIRNFPPLLRIDNFSTHLYN